MNKFIIIISIFLFNCYSSISYWKISDNVMNDCMLFSDYNIFKDTNPILYIINSDEANDILNFDYLMNPKDESIKFIPEEDKSYILLEDYVMFPAVNQISEFNLNINEKEISPLYKSELHYIPYGGTPLFHPMTRYPFESYPRRSSSLRYSNKKEIAFFRVKGKVYRYIYELPKSDFYYKIKINVSRGNKSQVYELKDNIDFEFFPSLAKGKCKFNEFGKKNIDKVGL